MKMIFAKVARRLGTLLGTGIGGFLVLTPAQTAQVEGALVVLLGIGLDVLVLDRH